MKTLKKWIFRKFSNKAKQYLQSYGLLQTVKLFNKSAIVWEPEGKRILVLAPHMDDEVIGCGGTLLKHIRNNAEVTVVFMTDGRTGSKRLTNLSGKERHKEEIALIETRKNEAELALKTLNIDKWFFLDGYNSNLISTKSIQGKLRQIILSVKPDVVYLPFFLEEHPDHRITNQILIDSIEGFNLQFTCMGYEVWTPLFPNCLVKINDTVEIKKQALLHYTSQLDDKDYVHLSLGLNAYRSGALLDRECNFAEAFFLASFKDYKKLYYSAIVNSRN